MLPYAANLQNETFYALHSELLHATPPTQIAKCLSVVPEYAASSVAHEYLTKPRQPFIPLVGDTFWNLLWACDALNRI